MADSLVLSPRIELQEHGAPVIRSANAVNAHAVAEANRRWSQALGLGHDPIRLEDRGDGTVSLRAVGVTGVVRVGHIDIEISPKFLSASNRSWQTVLWRILTVVEGGHIDNSITSAHELESLSMPDLLAEMFLSSYSEGAARGLPRDYLSQQFKGSTLRGSIDRSRLGEWLAQPWELPYVADLLTDDTVLARLLRWSAERLAPTVKSASRARALREIAAGLTHVGRRPPHLLDAQRLKLSSQHQGLEAARMVGVLLLDGAGVHHAQGDHFLSGFLWNSDVIYENYIYWLCQKAAVNIGGRVDKQALRFGELLSGDGSRLETTPDVVFRDWQQNAVAVTDSKYKRLGNRPKAADTYQALTAGHVLGCQRVSLTYPVSDEREPTVWRVQSALGGEDIELTALPLNLMALAELDGHQKLIEAITSWLAATKEANPLELATT